MTTPIHRRHRVPRDPRPPTKGFGQRSPRPPEIQQDTDDSGQQGATPGQVQAIADAAAQSGGGPMVVSGSTTAPLSAFQDTAQDQTDNLLDAFFSTGTGPALHYDPTQLQGYTQAASAVQGGSTG